MITTNGLIERFIIVPALEVLKAQISLTSIFLIIFLMYRGLEFCMNSNCKENEEEEE